MALAAKRLAALLFAVGIALTLSLPAFARGFYTDRDGGFYEEGGFSHTKEAFGFLTDESVLVTYNDVEADPYLDEVFSGSELWIPIGHMDDDTGAVTLATDKQIKDNKVTVSYKATTGSQYIESVEIINGKKAKKSEIASGAYAKVTFTTNYTGVRWANIDLMLVLSVNSKSCQETRINLVTSITNYGQDIDTNSVYTVKGPSKFESWESYNGEVTFDFGDKIRYTARVSRSGKYYLHLIRDEMESIAAMYPDAYLEFYNFAGDQDTFASVGRLELPIDRNKFKGENGKTQLYVYQIAGDELRSLGTDILTYDSSSSTLNLRTQSLDVYVLSNRALMREVDTSEEDIIKTGYASDLEELLTDTAGDTQPVNPTQTGTQENSNISPPPAGATTGNPDTGAQSGPEQNSSVYSAEIPEADDAEEAALEGAEDTQATGEAANGETNDTKTQRRYAATSINAANVSGYNPPTADTGRYGMIACAAGMALLLAVGTAIAARRV